MVSSFSWVLTLLTILVYQAKADYRIDLLGAKIIRRRSEYFDRQSTLTVINRTDTVAVLDGKLVFLQGFPEDTEINVYAKEFDYDDNTYYDYFDHEAVNFCEFKDKYVDIFKNLFPETDFSKCLPSKGDEWIFGHLPIDSVTFPTDVPVTRWKLVIQIFGKFLLIDFEILANVVKIAT